MSQYRQSGTSQHILASQLRSILKIMSGDVIEPFRISTAAANQVFVRRSQIELGTCQIVSNFNIWSVNHFFEGTPLNRPMFKKLDILQCKNERVPVKVFHR